MLDFLRRGVKSWVAKVLLALLILSFAVWGIGDIFSFRMESMVARVGQTEVTAQRFADTMIRQQQVFSRQRGELVSLQALREGGVDRVALNSLMRDAAFTEELRNMDVAVPDEAVRDTIMSNPSFQDGQGGFSQYLFQTRVAQEGYDPRTFEDLTRTLLGQQILRDAVTAGVATPPDLGQQIAEHRGEQREVATIRLSPSMAPDPGDPDEGGLRDYFEANSDDFVEPQRRWGRYLHVDFASIGADVAPSDEEVRAEYDANIDRYSVDPTRTLDQIVFDTAEDAQSAMLRMAQDGVTFEEIAAEQNIALEDLPLGIVTSDDLPAAAAAAVFDLTEPGIAGPIETPFGHNVYSVTAVEIGGAAPFEDVEVAIRTTMTQTRALERAPEAANLVDDLRADGKSLDEIAAETGHALVEIDGSDNRGNLGSGGALPLSQDVAFLTELAETLDGEERDLVELVSGGYVLVEIDRIVETHLPELADIRDKVSSAWRTEQRLLSLEKQAEELIAQFGAGTDFTTLAEGIALSPQEQPAFSRETPPPTVSSDLLNRIFQAENGALVAARSATSDAVIMAEVRNIVAVPEDVLTERTDAIGEALSLSMARDNLEYFARALEERHGAVIDENALDTVFQYMRGVGGPVGQHGGM